MPETIWEHPFEDYYAEIGLAGPSRQEERRMRRLETEKKQRETGVNGKAKGEKRRGGRWSA
jgi:hypothetical protein